MKNIFLVSSLLLLILASCGSQKKISSYADDVYANPTEDKIEQAKVNAIAKQVQELQEKRESDSLAALKKEQQTKDDANPSYKDREFKYDDYYDYEYATRVKRFNNRIDGLSYYDNYYTNSYWYNNNPYNYGVSVYNGYSWWGSNYNSYSYNPSVNFYNSFGWNSCPSYGYNGFNPYQNNYSNSYSLGFSNGYNQGYGNGYNGYPYNGYGYGYSNPYAYNGYNGYNNYNNPYNNGWGYYNSYDNNSSYSYGPRSSHGGGNSHRSSNPGIKKMGDDGYYNKLLTSVNEQQQQAVKFNTIRPTNTINKGNGKNTETINTTGIIKDNKITSPPRTITGGSRGDTNPVRNTSETRPQINNNHVFEQPTKTETFPGRPNTATEQPIKPNRGGVRGTNEQPAQPIRIPVIKQETAPNFNNQREQTSPSQNNNNQSTPASGGHRPR